MKRRGLNVRTGPRLLSQTAAALPNNAEESERMARDVYTAPYRAVGGFTLLVVVNARGERILEVPIAPGVDEDTVTIGLRAWLDCVDPIAKKGDERPSTPMRALRLVQ